MLQKIAPCLWFDGNAKEAIDYYVLVFPESKILNTSYYPDTAAQGLADFQEDLAGKELGIDFELDSLRFIAINAGPEFTFNEAISFSVACKDQKEIDYYWEKLSYAPEAEQCGWCKDQFGLSWQVVPEDIAELLEKPDAYLHMMQMKKLVIADF
jgi:predicted 3-demethylubiquinone-9 3-methyltransferase (glyoxalase superfamily)